MKSVATQSGVKILGINVDCIEVDGELDSKFVGEEIGMFKPVAIQEK